MDRSSKPSNHRDDLPLLHEFFGQYVKNSIALQGTADNPVSFSETMTKDSLKRMSASFVNINGSFIGCGFAESQFDNVSFNPLSFEDNNMQFCSFNRCRFSGRYSELDELGQFHYRGIWFDQSVFVDCEFVDIAFDFSSLSNSRFINCKFQHCRTWGTTIELSTFDHCVFEDVSFCWGNFEYANFIRCSYNRFLISVSQAPYVFGFDVQLQDKNVSYSDDETSIDTSCYIDHLSELIKTYSEKGEYFPAANIYQATQQYDKAYEILQEGIHSLSLEKQYDRVLRLAQLAGTFGNLTRSQMLHLLELVEAPDSHQNQMQCDTNGAEIIGEQRYILRYPVIQKHLLAMPGNNPELRIAIYTEASSQEERLELLDRVEKALNQEEKVFHSIEIQHNSDIIVIVDLTFLPESVSMINDLMQNTVLPKLMDLGLAVVGNAIWDAIKSPLPAGFISGVLTLRAKARSSDEKAEHGRHCKKER